MTGLPLWLQVAGPTAAVLVIAGKLLNVVRSGRQWVRRRVDALRGRRSRREQSRGVARALQEREIEDFYRPITETVEGFRRRASRGNAVFQGPSLAVHQSQMNRAKVNGFNAWHFAIAGRPFHPEGSTRHHHAEPTECGMVDSDDDLHWCRLRPEHPDPGHFRRRPADGCSSWTDHFRAGHDAGALGDSEPAADPTG